MIRGTKRRITDGILHSEMLPARPAGAGGRRARAPRPPSTRSPRSPPPSRSTAATCPRARTCCARPANSPSGAAPSWKPPSHALLPLLLHAGPGADDELGRRFQQTSGMVMAKGVEDTAFFRYTRLGTLTEVGADPTEFALSADEFHARMARRQAAPAAVHDHAQHPRHQAQRGHPGADLGARGAGARNGRRRCARLQQLAPAARRSAGQPAVAGRSPGSGRRTGTGSSPTRRRRPARPATPPTGWTRTRTSKRN